ncbi:PilZ domain-containing protein [uncultured Sphingomonas sp.]|uniref:PilZ domain-containing protein n=1 Tax=Sphingomonas sp. TaxID=28214 RepID=UPI002623486D|nr:PilZ domain-containing protein [uncultured Sphingomonas sp.]
MNGDDRSTNQAVADPERRAPRDSLFLMAQFEVAGQRHEVRVRNLSEGGLMAEFPRILEPGTPVMLVLRGIGEVHGKIAWCTQGRVGVAFDTGIDPQLARKPVTGGTTTPTYARSIPNVRVKSAKP